MRHFNCLPIEGNHTARVFTIVGEWKKRFFTETQRYFLTYSFAPFLLVFHFFGRIGCKKWKGRSWKKKPIAKQAGAKYRQADPECRQNYRAMQLLSNAVGNKGSASLSTELVLPERSSCLVKMQDVSGAQRLPDKGTAWCYSFCAQEFRPCRRWVVRRKVQELIIWFRFGLISTSLFLDWIGVCSGDFGSAINSWRFLKKSGNAATVHKGVCFLHQK